MKAPLSTCLRRDMPPWPTHNPQEARTLGCQQCQKTWSRTDRCFFVLVGVVEEACKELHDCRKPGRLVSVELDRRAVELMLDRVVFQFLKVTRVAQISECQGIPLKVIVDRKLPVKLRQALELLQPRDIFAGILRRQGGHCLGIIPSATAGQ